MVRGLHEVLPKGILLTAPHYLELDGPSVFTAGPIQGAERWQDEALQIIHEQYPAVNVFSPRRPAGQGKKEKGGFDQAKYVEQVDWETYYLNEVSVVMFYLAKESEHDCSRSFAQTSRFELAEWKVYHILLGASLVVGIEPGFTGERYIRHRFGQDCPDVPIFDNLEETALEAAKLANYGYHQIQLDEWADISASERA